MEIATELNAAGVQSTERTKPLRQSASVSRPLRKPVETGSGEELEKAEEVDTDEDAVTDSSDPVNYYFLIFYHFDTHLNFRLS